ncbi:hypothetical protein [Streptomyces venezuelae]|uniref:hypothetical protein n=1 Tax=Streptomyces venezuelae TaxID=54571 RepID=UPI000D96A5E4|nr:hypothetical protein [Streptomyces venezuelae]
MTSPTGTPANLPPQQCPPQMLGRCARCQAPCHRYGWGGNPPCQAHQQEAAELQKPKRSGA